MNFDNALFKIESINDPLYEQFRSLQSVIFPGMFDMYYYRRMITSRGDSFHVFVYLVDHTAVGCASIEVGIDVLSAAYKSLSPILPASPTCCAYVHSFGIAALYRRQGYGQSLWACILQKYPSTASFFLHVQTDNTVALQFYQSLGFCRLHVVPQFYRKLHKDAAILGFTRTE